MKKAPSSVYSTLRECLKGAREQSGLTQVQLAEAMGVAQSDISKIERGERRLDVVELVYVCRALGISSKDFISSFEARLGKDDQSDQ